jgi:hypothetical protein
MIINERLPSQTTIATILNLCHVYIEVKMQEYRGNPLAQLVATDFVKRQKRKSARLRVRKNMRTTGVKLKTFGRRPQLDIGNNTSTRKSDEIPRVMMGFE